MLTQRIRCIFDTRQNFKFKVESKFSRLHTDTTSLNQITNGALLITSSCRLSWLVGGMEVYLFYWGHSGSWQQNENPAIDLIIKLCFAADTFDKLWKHTEPEQADIEITYNWLPTKLSHCKEKRGAQMDSFCHLRYTQTNISVNKRELKILARL